MNENTSDNTSCQHVYIWDLIDVDLDRSLTISYCKFCLQNAPKDTNSLSLQDNLSSGDRNSKIDCRHVSS